MGSRRGGERRLRIRERDGAARRPGTGGDLVLLLPLLVDNQEKDVMIMLLFLLPVALLLLLS